MQDSAGFELSVLSLAMVCLLEKLTTSDSVAITEKQQLTLDLSLCVLCV